MSNLHELTATELRRIFQSRQASPVEYVQETFAHAESAERTINAFAETMFDQALDQATEAERRYGGKGEPPRPLEGLLVAVKEELDLAGHRKTNGVLGEDPAPVRSTDPAVERVLEAGGIVHARTTTSEFCTLPVSHTTRWGVTRNPWSPDWSTGGSSGGSAASVAAGTSALALGTDGGGSVRAPASLCGIVGYKAPYGRVPQPPPGNFDTWVHTGPLARSVEDCVLLQNVIAGPHPVDNAALAPKLVLPTPDGWIGDLRVGVCPVPGDHLVDQEVVEATLRVARGLVSAGAHVEEAALDWRRHEVYQAMWGHFGSGWAQEIQSAVEQRDASISPYTREFVERALRTAGSVTADEGSTASAELFAKLSASLDGLDVILVPTMGGIGYRAGEDYVEEPLVVAGTTLDHFVEASLTPALNACSRCPAISVPIGVASNGVPMGVQIIARPFEDLTVMRVAGAVEATSPWVRVAPLPVPVAR